MAQTGYHQLSASVYSVYHTCPTTYALWPGSFAIEGSSHTDPGENTPKISEVLPGGRRSPAVACWASDHWVASSNPLGASFRH